MSNISQREVTDLEEAKAILMKTGLDLVFAGQSKDEREQITVRAANGANDSVFVIRFPEMDGEPSIITVYLITGGCKESRLAWIKELYSRLKKNLGFEEAA